MRSVGAILSLAAGLLLGGETRAAGTFTYTVTETWTPSLTMTSTHTDTPSRSFTRTATQTRSATPTRTATATYVIKILVQGMAGERIRSFERSMLPETTLPREILVSPNPFSPDCDNKDEWLNVVGFMSGQQQIWDGRNQDGRMVENGRYWITVSIYDTQGVMRGQWVKDVLMLARGNVVKIRVYDVAGQVRREFPEICYPVRMTDFELDPNPFSPGLDSGNAWKYMQIKINGTTTQLAPWPSPPAANNNFRQLTMSTIYWLGDDGEGKLLPNGTYWVHAENIDPNGKKTIYSRSLIILRGKFELLRNLLAYPDPYFPSDETVMYFRWTMPNSNPADVRVRIYDLTGNFIAQREYAKDGGGPDPNPNDPYTYRVSWNCLTDDKKYLADGVYIAEYWGRDLVTKVVEVKRQKFVITRKSQGGS